MFSRPSAEKPSKEKYGLFRLVNQSPDVLAIDIIAVHGLGGSYDKTWTADNGRLWLRDFIPQDVPEARVFSYGYNSHSFFSQGTTDIDDEALMLLNRVYSARLSGLESKRPIIFVAHSLGGIIVKKLLILANERSRFSELLGNIKAIVFLGVPHRGADLAFWAHFATQIVKISSLGFTTNSAFVKALMHNSPALATITKQFVERGDRPLQIRTFFETKKLSGVLVVDKESACLNLPNETSDAIPESDHRSMCKFNDSNSQRYQPLRACIFELSKVSQPMMTAEGQGLLRSLAFREMGARYTAIENPLANTGAWIFSTPDFKDWYEDRLETCTESKFLWLKAKAGAGKSTLMKSVVSRARETRKGSIVLSFFFNARGGHELERSLTGLLRGLLSQLLRQKPSLIAHFLPEYRNKQSFHGSDWDWHVNELKSMVTNAIGISRPQLVWIYIDALDECPEDQARIAVELLEILLQSPDSNLRLFASSRHCPFISHHGREIEIGSNNAGDIRKYVDARLPQSIDQQDSTKIRAAILEKASDVFLWTVLIIKEIVKANDDGESFESMLSIVETAPLQLKEVYEFIIESINFRNQPKSWLVFKWVSLSAKPLHPMEVYSIIRFNSQNHATNNVDSWPSKFSTIIKAIRTYSGGLLEVKGGRRSSGSEAYVQFIHESVRDFLQSSRLLDKFLSPSPVQSTTHDHSQVATFCINYLAALPEFCSSKIDRSRLLHLLGIPYMRLDAWINSRIPDRWIDGDAERLRVDSGDEQQLLQDTKAEMEIPTFLTRHGNKGSARHSLLDTYSHRNSLEKMLEVAMVSTELKPLSLHASPRREISSNYLKLDSWQLTLRIQDGLQSPFPFTRRAIEELFSHVQKSASSHQVEERALDCFGRLNSHLWENYLQSIGYLKLWDDFFRKEERDFRRTADEFMNGRRREFSNTWLGRHSPRKFRMEVTFGTSSAEMLLRLAASLGCTQFVTQSVEQFSSGISPLSNARCSSALYCAMDGLKLATAAVLLNHGALIDFVGNNGSTTRAIERGGASFITQMMEAITDNRKKREVLRQFLRQITISWDITSLNAVIGQIMKADVDINTRFEDGRCALILISRSGSLLLESKLKVLIRADANPNLTDRLGRAALHYLVGVSNHEAIAFMLREGADINILDNSGQSPLDHALMHDNDVMVEFLRSHGAVSGSKSEQESTGTIDKGSEIGRSQGDSPQYYFDDYDGNSPYQSDSEDSSAKES